MCVTPTKLPDGSEVPCRKCWQCKANRVTDWVGRCIAEMSTSTGANSVTLTYAGGDHVKAAVLTYSDVQRYIKLLKRKTKDKPEGHPVRYFAVGEYGATKARAHWHVLLFWQGDIPKHVLRENFEEEHWPHGYSFWDDCFDASPIRYVCKYIQKDNEAGRQSHLSMSKFPPLGAQFFELRARQFVKQGISPQDTFYSFPGWEKRHVRYMLQGRSLDLFCEAFIREWQRVYGERHWWPHSVVIEDYLDRQARLLDTEWMPPRRLPGGAKPFLTPPEGSSEIRFSPAHNCCFVWKDGQRLWWSFDEEGHRSWESVIRTDGLTRLRALKEAQAYRVATGRH